MPVNNMLMVKLLIAFSNNKLSELQINEYDEELFEGEFHNGLASLINVTGVKK